MDKQDVFDYVMKTPDNTNPAILREMLDGISEGGNPNYVETITGTLANPFGSHTVAELAYKANIENSINMFIVVDGSSLGLGVIRFLR